MEGERQVRKKNTIVIKKYVCGPQGCLRPFQLEKTELSFESKPKAFGEDLLELRFTQAETLASL